MSHWTINLLETSDIHGNVLPINYGTNQNAELGFAKIASIIKKERQENPHTYVIDNGDLIQGTPLMYHYANFQSDLENPMVKITNYLKYDLSVLGNHEFNYGLDFLNKAVKESNQPWLSANILNKETKAPYFGQPYLIKEIENGPKIAFLGLTTKYIPNWEKAEHIENIEFKDVIETAQTWVDFLKREKQADIIVVSYHGGFEKDLDNGQATETLTGENQGYDLCMQVEGIDVLLTGHQHREIANKFINGVLVLQPGNNGMKLGKVSLQVEATDKGYKVIDKNSSLISAEGVKADPAVLDLITPYETATQTWLDQPIGHTDGDMLVHDPMQIRLADNPLIEFMNTVQMDASGVDVSFTALFDNFAPGIPENITMRSVVSNYIYPNTLTVLNVSGEKIKAALEKSATYFKLNEDGSIAVNPSFLEPKPQHFNYDMWEGIDYEIDVRKPVGQRVTKLNYKGKPVTDQQMIAVVMNNYRASGGGDYQMYQDCEILQEIQIDVSELIANYILKHKVIEAKTDNNWSVIY